MGIFDWLGSAISGVGNAVSKVIDSINAPEDKKQQIKSELQKELSGLQSQVMDYQANYEKELTERLKIDMQSDSWLSKNIRPLTLVFILTMYTITSIPSMFHVNGKPLVIDSNFISILKDWGQLAFMFYFGGRSVEKIFKTVKDKLNFGNKNNSDN